MKQLRNFLYLLPLIAYGCVEPYEFRIDNNEPSLVVEGYISTLSFDNYTEYPADGRYFTVKLRLTSDVKNVADEFVTGASVKIINDMKQEWTYLESHSSLGTYILDDKNFKAEIGVLYKLQITLSEGKTYESSWEGLTNETLPAIGNVGFQEVEKQVYVVEAGEEVVTTIKGINVFVELPPHDDDSPIYYKWDFDPTWIYIAPKALHMSPEKICWATNERYLQHYALQTDYVGGYNKNLFFMETVRNERIFERFSVLVRQSAVSEDFYYFWKEMQEQTQQKGLFDKPPYNLKTNIKSLTGEEKVSGYFGVVSEQIRRWYFNKDDLSYIIQNTMKADCEVVYGPGPPAPTCVSCLDYHNGSSTNVKPSWWE